MKKILLIAAGIAISIAGFSQLSVGLQGTGNLAGAQFEAEDALNFKKKMRAMPGAGVVLQYAVNKNLAIRTGANYVQNGVTLTTNVETPDNTMELTVKNNLNYVQIPVNILYTLPLSRVQFFVGGGGYVGYGISGKLKSKMTYTTADGDQAVMTEEVDAFKKDDDGGAGMKKTDYGVGALAGLRFNNAFVNVGYQLSLANIADNEEEQAKYKNRGLQLTIGFFFR